MSDFPSSKFERGKIFAKTGLKVGTNYAKYHLKNSLNGRDKETKKHQLYSQNANDVYNEFTKLRGTALKIAQSFSMDTSGILPEEFIEVMSQAQYKVPPINKALIRQLVKKELSAYPEQIFARFNTQALAAASIGQVHKATLKDGREVAVKIQYPNIRDTIESDLSLAKILFKRIANTPNFDKYFGEIKERLIEETDYIHEGHEIEFFSEKYSGGKFITPRWIEDLSTDKVLTMTYIEGKHLDTFLAEGPSQEKRNHYGQLLWDFFHVQINESLTIHADAHPGNFMYTPDGRLGILDFGCVKTFPGDFFYNYMSALPLHLKEDNDRLFDLYQKLDILDSKVLNENKKQEYFEFFKAFGNTFILPYHSDFFNFGNPDFKKQLNHFVKTATSFDEPVGSEHFIYSSKVHMGLYNMLIQLKAVVDTRESRSIVESFLGSNENRVLSHDLS